MSENKDYKIYLEYNRDQKEIEEPKDFDELKEKFFDEFNEGESKIFTFNFFEDDEDIEINEDNFSEVIEKIKKSKSKIIYVTEERNVEEIRQTQNFSKQFEKPKEKKKDKDKDLELERINELKNSNSSGQEGVSEFIMGKTLDERIKVNDNNSDENKDKKDEYENEIIISKENENNPSDDRNNIEIIKINSKDEPKELVNSEYLNNSSEKEVLNDSQNKYKTENDNLLKEIENEKKEKKKLEERMKSLKERIINEKKQNDQLKSDKKEIELKYAELELKFNESQSKIKMEESSDNIQIEQLKEKNEEINNKFRNLENENLKLKQELEKSKSNQDLNDSNFNLLKEENSQLKEKIKNLENSLTKKSNIIYNSNKIYNEKPETIFDEEEKEKIEQRKNKKMQKLSFINQLMKATEEKSNKQNKNKILNKLIEEENRIKQTNIEQSQTKLKLYLEKRNAKIMNKKEEEQKEEKIKETKNEELAKYKKLAEEKSNELKKRNEEFNNLQNELTKIEQEKVTNNKQLEDIDKERNDYKSKIKDLQIQLEDKNKKLNENQNNFEIMKKNSNELSLKMKTFQNESQNAQKKIDDLNKKIKILTQEKEQKENEIKDYQNQIEIYKSDLSKSQINLLNQNNQKKEYEIKKNEYNKNLEAKYEKLYQERITEAKKSINEQIKKHIDFIQNKYAEEIKILDNNCKKKFNDISQSILQNQNKSNLNKCQTRHEGIKCNVCFKSPIVGYRYKCVNCNNYNLCEECEEANEKSNAHPHFFIKMAKYIQNNNDNDNFIHEQFKNRKKNDDEDDNEFSIIKFGNKKDYSIEIINKDNLNPSIEEGKDNLNIKLIIKNNGAKQWPENGAKLVFNESKNLTARPIFLRPQKPEEQEEYEINMEDLHVYPVGKYEAEMIFQVDGKKYGDEIDLNITIEKKEGKIDDDSNAAKVQSFRDTYGLSREDYPDEKLLELLQKHNSDFPKAFAALFDD